MASDPFTILYDALIRKLRDAGLNVVSWNSTRNPQVDTLTTSDFPEWQLRPSAMSVKLGNASCSSEVIRDFVLTLVSGDLRVGHAFFPNEWNAVKALRFLANDGLDDVKFAGRNFVENVMIASITSGANGIDPVSNRQAPGWGANWNIRVLMNFSTQETLL